MTVEEIELRKILSQMLADNGINRETIMPFVKNIIEEKVEAAARRMVHDLGPSLEGLIRRTIEADVSAMTYDSIRAKVRDEIRKIDVSVHVSVPEEKK